jgi:hypothetical protein
VAGLDEEKIKERIKIKQPSDESDQPGAISRQFRFFYKEIKIGHLVFARKGLRKIIGLGVVTDEPYFDDKKAGQSNIRGYSHPNFLPVRWLKDFKPNEHKKLRLRAVEPFEDQKILDALENYLNLDAESSDNSAISDCDSPPIGTLSPDRAATSGWRYQRNNQVRRHVIEQAEGICECCGKLGFLLPDGSHYLEAHHVIFLANQGEDTIKNVIALCSSDHREAHYGAKAGEMENEMIKTIKRRNKKFHSA